MRTVPVSHVGPVVADASSVTEHFPTVANAHLCSDPVWDTAQRSPCDGQTVWQAAAN